MTRKLIYQIDDSFDGKTVLAFLKHNNFSSRLIKELKKNPHGILIGNKKVTVQKTLKKGNTLTVYIKENKPPSAALIPVYYPLEIVYEDKDVVVVNKPAFMATHPSQNNHGTTLANALAYHFLQNGGPASVRSVNRLDKNTSGLILIAKNVHASGVLSDHLKVKKIRREYLAFVEGCPDNESGTVDAPIARCEGSTIARCVDKEHGDRAVTHYTVLNKGEFSLLKLSLETGRTHQIRVHMSYIGHPVAGDFLYGHEFSGGINRHALHSYTLEFTHPVTGEILSFKAPLADDMRELYLRQWGEFDETFDF